MRPGHQQPENRPELAVDGEVRPVRPLAPSGVVPSGIRGKIDGAWDPVAGIRPRDRATAPADGTARENAPIGPRPGEGHFPPILPWTVTHAVGH
jgi:hypothetical protein